MAGRVDQIDEVVLLLHLKLNFALLVLALFLSDLVAKQQRDGGCFHRDASLLLVISRIQISQLPG